MSKLSVLVKSLSFKAEKLSGLLRDIKTENFNLKEDKNGLLKQIEDLNKKIQDLEERNKILKLAKSLSGTDEKSSAIKLKINELVREIDKSIALLNR